MSAYKDLKGSGKAFDGIKVLGDAFPKIKDFLGSLMSAGSILGAVKVAFSSLWGVIAANPFAAAVVGLTAFIAGMKKLMALNDKAPQKRADALFEANDSYEATRSEIESINSELETTQARMNELQAKGYLSLTEEEELFNLQQQNSELERSLALKEAQERVDARKLARTAEEAYDSYTKGEGFFGDILEDSDQRYNKETADIYKEQFSDLGDSISYIDHLKNTATDQWAEYFGPRLDEMEFKSEKDNVNYLLGGYKAIQEEREKVATEMESLAELSKESSGKQAEEYLAQSTALQEYSDNLLTNENTVAGYLDEYAGVMNEAYLGFKAGADLKVLTPEQQAKFEEAESFLTEYGKIMTNTAMDTEDAINNIFAKSEFAGLQEKLLSSGESGGPDAVAKLIAETPELTDALADAGIEAEQLTDHIMAIADPSKLRLDVVKEQLRDAFVSDEKDFDSAKVWDDLVEDKTDKEIEIFYRYKLEKNLDMSDWDAEDLQYNMQQALDWAAEENPLDFSSILSTEEMSKQIDDFQSNTSTIQSALASIKEGEDIDLTDLVQQFPELAGQTDNLQEALANLQLDKIHEFGESWKSALEGMDEADIPKANEFFSNLLDGIDLSGMNLSDLKKDITGALLPDPGDSYATDFLNEFETELSNRDDMELLWKIAMDPSNANKTVDELRATFDNMKLEAKAYVKWDENHPLFDEHAAAEQTENAGDRYLAMMEDFKKAQEDYENNLTGTDDFKTTAAMASPNGFTDPANWAENYGKVMRYFTEDKSGVLNFLTDLETKVGENGRKLAEYNENTGQWKLNLADMGDAADQLGISFEAFTAILGRLGDYGFTNDFFASVEEGLDKSADLRLQLADAKAKYLELEAEGASDSVLASQWAEVEALEARIRDVDSMLEQLASRTAEEAEAELATNARYLQSSIEEANRADNRYLHNSMMEEVERLAGESTIPLEFYTDENGLRQITEESYATLQEISDLQKIEVQPFDTSKMQASLTSAMEDETSGVKEQIASLKQYSKEELQSITFGDGTYSPNENLAEAERLLDGIMSATGYAQEDAQLLIATLDEMGFLKIDAELEDPNKIVSDVQSAVDSVPPAKVKGEVEMEQTDIPPAEQKVFQIPETGEIDSVLAEITEPAVKPIGFQPLGDVDNMLDDQQKTITVNETQGEKVDTADTTKTVTVNETEGEQVPDESTATQTVDQEFGTMIPITFTAVQTVNQVLGDTVPTSLPPITQFVNRVPIGVFATGTMLTTAHANGTAYNVHNLIPLSRANAMGSDVAIKEDQESLLNEIGQESLILSSQRKIYLIAGNPLELYQLQRRYERKSNVNA